MTTFNGRYWTDAEILDIRSKAFEEAKRYAESLEKENERLREALTRLLAGCEEFHTGCAYIDGEDEAREALQ